MLTLLIKEKGWAASPPPPPSRTMAAISVPSGGFFPIPAALTQEPLHRKPTASHVIPWLHRTFRKQVRCHSTSLAGRRRDSVPGEETNGVPMRSCT